MTRLLPILFLILTFACDPPLPHLPREKGFFKKTKRVIPVVAKSVTGREISLVASARGKTQAADRLEVKAPEGGGTVGRIFVEEGQRVEQGAPLLAFDTEELRLKLEVARTEIEEAEAGLDLARSGGTTRRPLPREIRPATQEEEPEETAVEDPEKKRTHLEKTLARAQKQVELYEKQMENVQVTSSLAGLVTKRAVTEGQRLEAGKLLLEVIRTDPLWFSMEIPLEVAGTLSGGQRLSVRFSEFGRREFWGEVLSIGAEAVGEGKVQVKLTLPNEGQVLKAGMEGEVTIFTPLKKKVFSVPRRALVKTERSNYLYKVAGEKVKKLPVEIAGEEEGEILVQGEIREGDLVVTSNVEELKDGATIEVQTGEL